MRTALVALLGAAVLHSQPAPGLTPTPPIKNFAEGWLAMLYSNNIEMLNRAVQYLH